MLDKNSLIPLYVQLENLLLEMIESGELKVGDIIPSFVIRKNIDLSFMLIKEV